MQFSYFKNEHFLFLIKIETTQLIGNLYNPIPSKMAYLKNHFAPAFVFAQ